MIPTPHLESLIRAMAAQGYGWEDISVKMRISGDWVRRVVFDEGKKLSSLRRATDKAEK